MLQQTCGNRTWEYGASAIWLHLAAQSTNLAVVVVDVVFPCNLKLPLLLDGLDADADAALLRA